MRLLYVEDDEVVIPRTLLETAEMTLRELAIALRYEMGCSCNEDGFGDEEHERRYMEHVALLERVEAQLSDGVDPHFDTMHAGCSADWSGDSEAHFCAEDVDHEGAHRCRCGATHLDGDVCPIVGPHTCDRSTHLDGDSHAD